jgi:DNA-binding response OmpR family regulator
MPKIMLVEDDNNLREIYGERLMAEGYEIIAANDGEEALALAVKEKPDLIISDVMMPKISGFDMLDILRQTPETKNTKVIMMTALSQTEDKDRADRLGADKYLVKSQVTLEDVARVVHDMLYGENQDSSNQDNPTISEPTEISAEPPATNNNTETIEVPKPNSDINATLPATPIEDSTMPLTPVEDKSAADEATAAEEKIQTNSSEGSETVVTDTKTTKSPEVGNSVFEENTVNPITGETALPDLTNTNATGSANANSNADEINAVNQTIENFVATQQENEVVQQAPLLEPTEQEMIHAQNVAEEPKVEQPAIKDGVVDSASNSVPPIIETSQHDIIEPASSRKKVIMPPPPDPNAQQHDINSLYEKEIADKDGSTTKTQDSKVTVNAEFNPIVQPIITSSDKPLETVDTTQINGIYNSDDEEDQTAGSAPVSGSVTVVSDQPVQEPPTEEPTTQDPNHPDQIAL